mgnify:CR=1 FL=1
MNWWPVWHAMREDSDSMIYFSHFQTEYNLPLSLELEWAVNCAHTGGCAAEGRTRVVLIHHPPAEGASKPKHDLLDRAAFAAVVARCGAELMLHGHEHKDMHTTLEGPDGEVPIFGVPSGTSIDERPGREGGFALFELGARTARQAVAADGRCLDLLGERRAVRGRWGSMGTALGRHGAPWGARGVYLDFFIFSVFLCVFLVLLCNP